MFVECLLGLESDEIGEFLGSTVLAKVVELLVDLDVSSYFAIINWNWINCQYICGRIHINLASIISGKYKLGRYSTGRTQ